MMMDNLEKAVTVADQIRDALRVEVDSARGERALIRAMDVEALMRRAAQRAQFNALVGQRQEQLSTALAVAAGALGLREVSLPSLREAAPEPSARLDEILAEVRALSAALAELDELNRALGQRALSFVRAYLGALSPAPAAYNRRGAAAAAAAAAASRAGATMSRVV
jgi:hypothetical protein